MSALNRSIRVFLSQQKPPSRIAADLEGFIRERERASAEKAWGEGFDAGERDAMQHETFNEPCIENPYIAAALGLTAGQEGETE